MLGTAVGTIECPDQITVVSLSVDTVVINLKCVWFYCGLSNEKAPESRDKKMRL